MGGAICLNVVPREGLPESGLRFPLLNMRFHPAASDSRCEGVKDAECRV